MLITIVAAHTHLNRNADNKYTTNQHTINKHIRDKNAAIINKPIIGRDNLLPFRLPQDLRRFKKITMGKPIIMGRKTYESIGKLLPGRENIIISRSMSTRPDGFKVFNQLEEGLKYACKWSQQQKTESDTSAEVMIIGGAEIYTQTIDKAQRMHITEVDFEVEGADAFFPEYNMREWEIIQREEYIDEGIPCVYKLLERNGLHTIDGLNEHLD